VSSNKAKQKHPEFNSRSSSRDEDSKKRGQESPRMISYVVLLFIVCVGLFLGKDTVSTSIVTHYSFSQLSTCCSTCSTLVWASSISSQEAHITEEGTPTVLEAAGELPLTGQLHWLTARTYHEAQATCVASRTSTRRCATACTRPRTRRLCTTSTTRARPLTASSSHEAASSRPSPCTGECRTKVFTKRVTIELKLKERLKS